MCQQLGLDLATDRIPVGPAAHYVMGGIQTDDRGRTSLPGLFAAGETACTGVHGANRLASNSLLEGLVFGARAADAMQQPASCLEGENGAWRLKSGKAHHLDSSPPADLQALVTSLAAGTSTDVEVVRDLMWRAVGLFRRREGLRAAVSALEQADPAERAAVHGEARHSADAWRRFNLVLVSRLVAAAALRREESRGGHFREDFPARDDERWRFHAVDQR
jgi:L-aspartate oxidase